MLILSQSYIHMLLLTGCCYQPDVVTNRVLLPTGCCYQTGVVTSQVLLPTGCCYQPGVVTNWVLLPTGCCYQPDVVINQINQIAIQTKKLISTNQIVLYLIKNYQNRLNCEPNYQLKTYQFVN